jgi:hypothetical protein
VRGGHAERLVHEHLQRSATARVTGESGAVRTFTPGADFLLADCISYATDCVTGLLEQLRKVLQPAVAWYLDGCQHHCAVVHS